MTDYLPQIVDPYAPGAMQYGVQAEAPPQQEYDESDVPITAVDAPWASISGEERGQSLQEESTTALGDQYAHDPYTIPGSVKANAEYSSGPGNINYGDKKSPPSWQSGAIRTGAVLAASAGAGHLAGMATEKAAEGSAGQMTGQVLARAGQVYAGYTAAPYGAMFEREYMGGYSPGYAGSGSATPMFQAMGARTDQEAKQARGERIGMSGAGAIAGAMTGGGWGAIYGAAGAQFAENPYSGKRGYQEEYKYNFKPMAEGIGRDMKSGPGQKGGYFASLTSGENWKDSLRSAIPGMAGLGGGGKKPPPSSEIKRDIQYGMAQNVNRDFQIQEWWNAVATKGSSAGREYVKGGLATEGREWANEENYPEWASAPGKWGSGDHPYQYGPEEVGGKRVASAQNVGTLAALQNQLEGAGSRKKFWKQYMQDYNPWQEGGKGLSGRWKGKTLYNVPSEVSGLSPSEMWGDIDFGADYNDLDWLRIQEEEEGEA